MICFSEIYCEIQSIYNDCKKYKIFSDCRLTEYSTSKLSVISWHNYKSGISKRNYLQIFRDLVSTRQYTYLFSDSSMIQYYYEFNHNIVQKAKLAYFPIPSICNETCQQDLLDYIENYEYDESEAYELLEQNSLLTNTSHIRIDYDKNVTSHDICEVQIDSIKEIRIPCEVLINPVYFFIFILKCKTYKNPKYADIYKKMQTDGFLENKINIYKKNCLKIEPFTSDSLFITFLLN